MALLAGGGDPLSSLKLIKLIYETAHKAKVHRETCNEFASYLGIINNLLAPLRSSPQLIERAAVQSALAMLQRTLMKAFLLIQKCERTSTLSALLKHVPRQLKELEGDIQKTLALLNLANLHVNLNITTNDELNKTVVSNVLEMASPTLGASTCLEEAFADCGVLSKRCSSGPSTSGQTPTTDQMLSSRSLSVTWGADDQYWKWVDRAGSRFGEAAYVVDVYWLQVEGHLNTATLRPGVYSLSWRLQLACLEDDRKPSGWDSQPVLFQFSTADGRQRAEREYFVGRTGMTDKRPRVQNCSVDELNDGAWMEYVVGTFTVEKQGPVELTFSMKELVGGWKHGLFLDGVCITPYTGPSTSSADGSWSRTDSTGPEYLSNLPGIVSFSGHAHDLKLMRDPFWFTCGVCESTELEVGYHCHMCRYSVHPRCCISEHQFASLLQLADSELSHWHWETLLELNLHRTEQKALRPKTMMFARHPHLVRLKQSPHPSLICDARDCDAQGSWVFRGWDGWTYQCEECDFDVHPECRFGG